MNSDRHNLHDLVSNFNIHHFHEVKYNLGKLREDDSIEYQFPLMLIFLLEVPLKGNLAFRSAQKITSLPEENLTEVFPLSVPYMYVCLEVVSTNSPLFCFHSIYNSR